MASSGCLATLMRMPYVEQIKTNKGEWLYNTTELAVWSTVEVGIGITAASLPTLRPILQPLLTRFGIDVSSGYQEPTINWVESSRKSTGLHIKTSNKAISFDDTEKLAGKNDLVITTMTETNGHGPNHNVPERAASLTEGESDHSSDISRVVEVGSIRKSAICSSNKGHGETIFIDSSGYQTSTHHLV